MCRNYYFDWFIIFSIYSIYEVVIGGSDLEDQPRRVFIRRIESILESIEYKSTVDIQHFQLGLLDQSHYVWILPLSLHRYWWFLVRLSSTSNKRKIDCY